MAEDPEPVVQENRRLQRQVKQLRAQVAAFESSRWWRLHPRFALARLRPRSAPQDQPSHGVPPATTTTSAQTDVLAGRFREEVVSRGSFKEDWFTLHIATWEPILRKLENSRPRILEIGSFEGLSACYLLWRLPDGHITCVDTFAGAGGYEQYGIDVSSLENVFERNVSLVDSSRVRKLVGDSRRILLDLLSEENQFDLVYVDGSHLALDVLVDASLAWRLLDTGGIAIFDDYAWNELMGVERLSHPGPAVDAFLSLVEGQCEVLSREGQCIARKTS